MKWVKFFNQLQQDLKVFFSIWLLLCLFRIGFILCMNRYISPSADWTDFISNSYYGMKISLKSAGVALLFTFLFSTVPQIILNKKIFQHIRYLIGNVFIILICILFMARFAFYQEFHVGFNQFVFNVVNDDMQALFLTVLDQYQLVWRLLGAILFSGIFIWLFKRILALPVYQWTGSSDKWREYGKRIGVITTFILFSLFIRFGGSFSYASSIHWENCAKTKDDFLNEMILDDIQAMYRGYSINERITNGIMTGVEKDKIKAFAAQMNQGDTTGKKLDDCLLHKANGALIEKPNKIFIIIGESYAQWPLLEKYKDLNLYPNLRRLMMQENADSISTFLPNGAFTPMAVNAIISGLSDVNIYPNQQAESYKSIYASGLAPQMKKLGYKTEFWYAGFSSWERIKDFALAQGFDAFYSCSDYYPYEKGNVWGADDRFMFESVSKEIQAENEPTVSVILTVSNHAPYSVDLVREGFQKEAVRALLPEECRQNEDLLNRLGHLWYTDKMIGEFIENTKRQYPDSLFIVTGDHADRTNIDDKPSLYERYTIPFVIYGKGVHKGLLGENIAGSHVNIIPTLIELIAPKDFAYYAISDSLTEDASVGFNHNLWITSKAIGKIEEDTTEMLQNAKVDVDIEHEKAMEEMHRMRTISWWRTMKGNDLN